MALREPVHDHVDHENHAADAYIDRMSAAEKAERLAAVKDWQLRDERLHRTYACATFAESISFINDVAAVAERLNHHPHLCLEDKRQVTVTLWTHKLDRLTWLDFDLAAEIDVAYATLTGQRA
jgi:4a-hydroxytetrahydrobiopterin dehydratase